MVQEGRATTEHEHIGERKKRNLLRYSEGKHEDDATKKREKANPVQRPGEDVADGPILLVA